MARKFGLTSSFIFACLFISTSLNASNLTALNAFERGDYAAAAKEWLELANQGDAEAQYNLALLYEHGNGVSPDKNLSRYWFSMAARQGMAQAYALLNKRSVAPDDAPAIPDFTVSPQKWVAMQNPSHYTLQLASSTNQDLIKKYYEENGLEGKAGYYSSMRQQERWYALVYGSYGSVQEAKAAIADLPKDLRKWSPWVRNIRSIHKIMLPTE